MDDEVPMQSEIRAVVLGSVKSLKDSVINTVLGENVEFERFFVNCVRREGEVNGRRVVLINTTSWWKVFGEQDSPEVVKQELVCSVFSCPPGPHVFLLVVDLTSCFTDEDRVSVEEHVSLFGERIWSHTVLIFTRAPKGEPIEEHGGDLQHVLQKCGGRYQVLEPGNGEHVKDLLGKIDAVVSANRTVCFDPGQDELLEIKRRRDANQAKAEARRTKMEEQRKRSRKTRSSEERVLVLLGWIVSGKSSVGNTIFNDDVFKIGKTTSFSIRSGDVNHRRVTVMDTPGCWKYFSPKFNPECVRTSILECIKQSESSGYPHAVLLVVPLDTAFKEEQRRVIEEYMGILGEDVWRHAVIVFTWADRFPDIPIERHIESEGEPLQWLIRKCGTRYHTFDNTNRENRRQVTQLLQNVDAMVEENSCLRLGMHSVLESNLNNDLVLKLLREEFQGRLDKFKRKMGKTEPKFMDAKSDNSMKHPPKFSDAESLDELIKLIKREVSRWEVIEMDEFSNISQDSETCDDKVLGWLQRCEEYSAGYHSSKNRDDITKHTEHMREDSQQ